MFSSIRAVSVAVVAIVATLVTARPTNNNHIRANSNIPYYVNVRNGLNERVCAGTIVSADWILTAASCQTSNAVDSQQLVVAIDQTSPSQLFAVNRTVVHPQYDQDTLHHDLALLRLNKPLPLGGPTKPIRLPSEEGPLIAARVMAITQMSDGDNTTDELLHTDMIALSTVGCLYSMLEADRMNVHNETMCAYPDQYTPGRCKHEAGGPIVSGDVLIGIGAQQDCEEESPEMYTAIQPYLTWIKRTVFDPAVQLAPTIPG